MSNGLGRATRLRLTRSGVWLLPLGLLVSTGCASWSYQQIQLGQAPSEYDHRLPSDTSRRTPIGLCDLRAGGGGDVEALLVLLATDRRVSAKFHAKRISRDYGVWERRRYTLIGVIDLARSGLPASEPTDALRAILLDIVSARTDRQAHDAHSWIAAGILRLIQARAPDADLGIAADTLAELVARVPAGGSGSASVSEGVLHVSYEQSGE